MQRPIRLMTLAPGHFHAALVQKHMVPGVHRRAHVYAPLDDDTLAHLARVASFNGRRDGPTYWEVDARLGGAFLDRMLREQPGNTVVLAGRNRPKVDRLLACVSNNLHVLADKPWVVDPRDFGKLEEVFRQADLRDAVAWDLMTERHEPATALQRELARDPDVFGTPVAGTPDAPGMVFESVHYLRKTVAGRGLRRPPWWFDPDVAGVGLADVGTHLADLAMWVGFPDVAVDHRRDVAVLDATVWPTPVDRDQYEAVTGRPDFPGDLPAGTLAGDKLLYPGNGTVLYTLRGVHVRLTVQWGVQPAAGEGDAHQAVVRGTKATLTVRPVATGGGGWRPELFVAAADAARRQAAFAAVGRRCQALQGRFPGVSVLDLGGELQVVLPDALRTTHEDHFAAVFREFAHFFQYPKQVPAWERSNLLAKYYVTTQAVAVARRKAAAAKPA